jgi:selenocysteine lyase/cysteine desulfurase
VVTTYLFEKARDIVIEYLGLNRARYVVIFCTPLRAADLKAQLKPGNYKVVSSQDIGLPLGVRAIAVKRKALPGGAPFQTGGGTTRLISPDWVIWADSPGKFEAGTPAIVNIIAFARALKLTGHLGNNAFRDSTSEKKTSYDILFHDDLEEYSGRKLLDGLRHTLIGRGVLVPTTKGPMPFINLDNGASTPTFGSIWNAFCQTLRQNEQIQQEIISEARSLCAKVLGAPLTDYDIIFTSNTTEAINLVAESLSQKPRQDTETVVLNTLLEHNSNELPWRMVHHFSLIRLQVNREGFVDMDELDKLLNEYNQKSQYGKKRIKLIAVTGASNVLGVFNNLEEIGRLVHRYGAHLLVDAAQMVAHRKVDIEQCGIDYLAFSAHKVYAPFGCGVLVVRKGLLGLSQARLEIIRSSGKENAAGIAALGKALVLLQRIGLGLVQEEEQTLTGRALRSLAQIKGLVIYGINDPDSPGFARKGGVITFTLKNMMADKVARALAERGGIGVRSGCHCAHMLVKHLVNVGPRLEQFQRVMLTLLPWINLPGIVRISLGIENNEEDIDALIRVLREIAKQTGTIVQRPDVASHEGQQVEPQKKIKKQINDFVAAAAQRVYA